VASTHAQEASKPPLPPATTSASLAVTYPESTGGLEQLAKDMLSALQSGDENRATALAQAMVLPDPAAWYHQTFGDYSSKKEIAAYEQDRLVLAAGIVAFFRRALKSGETSVRVKYFDSRCDDSDGLDTFPILDARINGTDFYDVRLVHGNTYLRLWPLAYGDANFRFVGVPHPWEYFPTAERIAQPPGSANSETEQPPAQPGKEDPEKNQKILRDSDSHPVSLPRSLSPALGLFIR
jgi:hypothetical protein